MTQINKNGCQYIEHHGMKIREDQLVSMAKKAGIYADAKPYVESILYHAVKYKVWDLIYKVIEIWDYYGVKPYSLPDGDEDEVVVSHRMSVEDQARKKYLSMTIAARLELLHDSLGTFRVNYPNLFRFKNQWQGIYMVIHDRLDGSLTQKAFICNAMTAMPLDWPDKIAITGNEFKNLRRDSQIEDYDETYYEMKNNPHRELCDAFWEVIKQLICGIIVEE